jgi:nucleotide-binding universal stress UspA family protein
MYRRILIAYDGSSGAEKALKAAITTAKEDRAELHLVAVEEGLPRYAATADELEAVKEQKDSYYHRLCDQAEVQAELAGVHVTSHVVTGHPGRAIAELARQLACDLIVAGFQGHSALHDRLWGSTTHAIVSESDCSVLIVR